MKNFVYYQPNLKDLKDTFGDCVIRALTKVFNKPWKEMYDELVPIARELQCMPNQKNCYEKYLLDNGFQYFGISNKKGTKRPTIKKFALTNKSGIFIVNVANHVCCIIDGKYYDTWDSGDKCMYGYYTKQ